MSCTALLLFLINRIQVVLNWCNAGIRKIPEKTPLWGKTIGECILQRRANALYAVHLFPGAGIEKGRRRWLLWHGAIYWCPGRSSSNGFSVIFFRKTVTGHQSKIYPRGDPTDKSHLEARVVSGREEARREGVVAEIMPFSPKDNRLQTSLVKKWLG